MSGYELFHRIAHPPSAAVRRFLNDHALWTEVRARNVDFPEAQAAFAARGGQGLPALWDGQQLVQGAEAVLARLQALLNIGRAP
jgi:hypothetical protein